MAPRSKGQISRAQNALAIPDTLEANQIIARVDKALPRGQYNCLLPSKSLVVVDLDERFRQTIWVQRGYYVLLERYPPKEIEGEAVAKIINIVTDEKQWRKMPYWPAEFPKFRDPESDEDESNVGKMPPSDSEDDA